MTIILEFSITAFLLIFLAALQILRAPKKGLLALTYNNIGTPPKNDRRKHLWIKPKKFKKQLSTLKKKGYKFIQAGDLHKLESGQRNALITFNCGYDNFYTHAYPVLKELGIPALVFLAAAGTDSYNFWYGAEKGPWQDMLTSEEIKIMQKEGLISFGSCGLRDIDLSKEAPEVAENEVKESAARLNNFLNIKPDFYAVPASAKNPPAPVLRTAEDTYKYVFSGEGFNPLPLKGKIIKRCTVKACPLLPAIYN